MTETMRKERKGMFLIDNQSRLAVYEQIIAQAERFILTGILKSDEMMPSVRSLSLTLAINPNTIQKAYSDLERRGITYTVKGKGSFVSPSAAEILSRERLKELDRVRSLSHELAIAGIDKKLVYEAVDKGYSEKGDEQN
ncbi:MAG: GntR family transcriptional regulator [Ruminococcaceae bacterium]|nr:GntR family transcriptional regulator [Oscillospiraceae bacterium]